MKFRKIIALFMAAALSVGVFASCGGTADSSSALDSSLASENSAVSSVPESSKAENSAPASTPVPDIALSAAALKGPTGLGMLKLMDDAAAQKLPYTFTMAGAPEDVVSKLATGELDIATVPTNLAATLYKKTNGGVRALAVTTLGVLSLVQKNENITSIADLKGKTIIASGKGTTAQYTLEYLLKQNGLDPEKDVTIDYKAEHAEAATAIAAADSAVGMLPQPFVTTITMQNPDVTIALDLSAAWEKTTGKKLPMSTVIVRTEFLDKNPDAVKAFLEGYAASIAYTNEHPAETAALSEAQGLLKAAVAEKAIPNCNIVYLDGADMVTSVKDFLQILFDFEPKSVGGTLPNDDFYVAN